MDIQDFIDKHADNLFVAWIAFGLGGIVFFFEFTVSHKIGQIQYSTVNVLTLFTFLLPLIFAVILFVRMRLL